MLAPDGKALYFSWRVTGVPQVWKLDGPQRFPVQLTGGEDATLIQDVSPDGRWLVLSRDRKGEENPGLYLQAASGGALREVQHKPGVQTQFQFLSKDGQWLYYRSNDERADSYTLYRYRLADGRRERLFGERGAWSIAGHRDDGRLLLQKTLSNASAEFYLWTPDGKPLQPLLGKGETTDYRMDFGLRDGEYLVRTNKFGEYHRLYLWRAGVFKPLTPETRGDVENLNIDREQGRVYYTLSLDGYGKALALDGRRHYRALKLPAFPGAAQVNVVNLSRDGRYVNFSVETDTAPASSHVWDSKSGKLDQWLLPSAPELDTRGFAKEPGKLSARATARRFRCLCVGRLAARPRPARWWSTSTAARKGRAAPASRRRRNCSSTPASSMCSPMYVALSATAKPGWTATTARAGCKCCPTSKTPRVTSAASGARPARRPRSV
ncbi:hypothetical protein JOS77_14780 [Chromobacterium haemolyticum]|nr:hypothetical protein JOS77_14780 [Chromobacterium haemolyticum]